MTYLDVLARCYVALCEVDYDLAEWRRALTEPAW